MSELLTAAGENLGFLGVCILVFAGMFLVAFVAQRAMKARIRTVSRARYVALVALFAAISGALMFLEIPLFFAPPFYQIDFSEIPVLMCGFYLGPVAGVVAEFIKVVIKLMLKGTSSAFVGDFANFVVGCTFILPASIIYHARKSRGGAIVGLGAGAALMTVFGSLFNALYLIPTFAVIYGMPIDAIVGMGTAVNPSINSVTTLVLMAVVPFNLLKTAADSVITFFLYKRVEKLFFRREKLPSPAESKI